MPHHESGLLALRTTDPKVIDRAAQHFLDRAPHPRVELVKADGGKGVWLCFGSFVDTDVSSFLDARGHAKLAKALGQPIWVGHAIGGYSNFQTAMAFSAQGKRLWSSTNDFNFSPRSAREANDPFTGPERRFELIKQLRAEAGYGRIGTEFGLDYFRVLSIDAGDALFAKEKRVLGKKGAKEHTKWLRAKFVAPEGEPGDGAIPPSPADRVAFRFLAAVDLKELVGALAHLSAHRKLKLEVKAKATKTECVVVLEGPGVRALSGTLCSEHLLGLLYELGGASLQAFAWDEGEEPALCAARAGADGLSTFLRMQREPLSLKGPFKPLPLTVSPALAKRLDQLRKAIATAED